MKKAKKSQNHSNNKYTHTKMESTLCCSSTLEHRSALPGSVVDSFSVPPLRKTDFSLCQQVSILKNLLIKVGTFVPFSVLEFYFPWNCAGLVHAVVCVSWYVHPSLSVWKTLLPWNHPSSLTFTISLPPLPHRSLSLQGRNLMKTYHLGLGVPRSFIVCT